MEAPIFKKGEDEIRLGESDGFGSAVSNKALSQVPGVDYWAKQDKVDGLRNFQNKPVVKRE